MLSGSHPFDPNGDLSEDDLKERIRSAPLDFAQSPWDEISYDAKQVVNALLRRDPAARPTATQLLAHPWVQSTAPVEPLRISASRLANGHVGSTNLPTRHTSLGG